MAQVAYDLSRFAPPQTQRPPRVRVMKREKRQRSAHAAQLWKTARLLLGAVVLGVLVCALLYTQAAVTEVTAQIAEKKTELKEEEANNTYLSFELENKTSLKSIEDAALAMGMSKVDGAQISYFKVGDDDAIRVKEGAISAFFQSIWDGIVGVFS